MVAGAVQKWRHSSAPVSGGSFQPGRRQCGWNAALLTACAQEPSAAVRLGSRAASQSKTLPLQSGGTYRHVACSQLSHGAFSLSPRGDANWDCQGPLRESDLDQDSAASVLIKHCYA